jgi:hypothetical protein
VTQRDAILDLLMEQGEAGVTPALAFSDAGCMRLAARIDELKRDIPRDWEIVNKGFTTPRGARVACYVLRRREPHQEPLWAAS